MTDSQTQLTDQDVQKLVQAVLAIDSQVEPFTVILDAKVKAHLLRAKPSAGQFVPLLVALAEKYGVAWTGYSLADLQADQAMADRLQQLATPVASLLSQLTDTVFDRQTKVYSGLTAIYGALSALAQRDGDLDKELMPLRTLFIPKKKPVHRKKPTPAVTPPPAPASSNAGATSADPVKSQPVATKA